MPKSCRAPHCSNAAGQARPPGRRLSFYKSVPAAGGRGGASAHSPAHGVGTGVGGGD
uniref:Uncharacterized protein n=1 Tax=Falco tinnunculus TaxID=100819 RepID=A0A8C4UEH5_FALTI